MNAAPFRITLGRDGKRPRSLTRVVSGVTLDGAVLCAQQWTVWGRQEKGRGTVSYARYSVEARNAESTWHVVSQGTLQGARLAWTTEDEARIDAQPDMQLDVPQRGSASPGKARRGRTSGRGKSRLALLVTKVLNDKR